MRLEMGNIYIKDIQFADTSKIEDGILYVDKGAVKAVALEDEHIKTVTFDIAKPGESVRITPVKDVIEPRVKVEGKGGVFPGIISKVDTVGSGKTYALKGMAVVTAGRIVGFQEGIIDMTTSVRSQFLQSCFRQLKSCQNFCCDLFLVHFISPPKVSEDIFPRLLISEWLLQPPVCPLYR